MWKCLLELVDESYDKHYYKICDYMNQKVKSRKKS